MESYNCRSNFKKYCNVLLLLKTPFEMLMGLFNNLQLGTTIKYNTVAGFHNL
jgi:hypothetical protein